MKSISLTIFIFALKKTVAFSDDLVKKLDGVSLIQRSINKAIEINRGDVANIHVLTDSEEISLIAKRNEVKFYLSSGLNLDSIDFEGEVWKYIKEGVNVNAQTLFLSPYAPLLPIKMIHEATRLLSDSQHNTLKPVKLINRNIYGENKQTISQILFGDRIKRYQLESKAFVLIKSNYLKQGIKNKLSVLFLPVQHDLLEIESFQDWWVCEKLLQRRRIIFRVIGNNQVGMGHIYRALSLAHEITDHEIIFVSDTDNTTAVHKLAGYDYRLDIYEPDQVTDSIINLKPDLVINDILSTSRKDLQPLLDEEIKVVNFEDMGDGVEVADLIINEFYDDPILDVGNILWGHKYFFVRDEFHNARPHRFKKKVDTIMLAFGGTDQHNFASRIYSKIRDLCKEGKIHVYIVAGAGYAYYEELKKQVGNESNVSITKATGVISSIMEQSQIAIVSNGRTVYELAHMNIPAIVISQHLRESTHKFACEDNGFVSVGLYNQNNIEEVVKSSLEKLLIDQQYRHHLFKKTTKYNFSTNKKKILKKILQLLP